MNTNEYTLKRLGLLDKFKANFEKQGFGYNEFNEQRGNEDFRSYLYIAFAWTESNEGFNFWLNVAEHPKYNLRNNKRKRILQYIKGMLGFLKLIKLIKK